MARSLPLLLLLPLCSNAHGQEDPLLDLAKQPAKDYGVHHFELGGTHAGQPVLAHVFLRLRLGLAPDVHARERGQHKQHVDQRGANASSAAQLQVRRFHV